MDISNPCFAFWATKPTQMWRDIAQHKSSAISDTRQHRAFSSQQTTLWPPCVATHAANSRSVSTNPDRQAHTDTDLLQCPVGSQPSRRARCQTPSRPGSGQQHPTAKHHRFDPCHSKQTRYLQRLGRRTRSKRPVRAHCNARLTVLCCAVLRCVVWCGVVWCGGISQPGIYLAPFRSLLYNPIRSCHQSPVTVCA